MRTSLTPFDRLTLWIAALLFCATAPLALAGNPPQISAQPNNQTAGVGATVNFVVVASGDPTLLYQWSFDLTNMPGATNQILTIPTVQASNQGSYRVVVTNNYGSATSTVAYLQSVLTPAVSGYNASSSLTEGSTAAFSVFTTGQPPLTFQWDFDGAAIAGATTSTLTIPNVQSSNSGSYQVFITNSYGHTSSPILPMTVTLAPVVNGTTTSGPAALGGTAAFTAFVEGAAPLVFQWYFEPISGASTNAMANATNLILTISNVQLADAGSYQLLVTNAYGSAQSQPLPLQINTGFVLANVATQFLQVGQDLTFTNQVFGGTLPIRFFLSASDPAGACVGLSNGVFSWMPSCDQGSTTNAVTIWAIDSSSPPASNSMTFAVIVGPCTEVSVGSGPVQTGHSICIPINLFSSGTLTNLSFSIQTLADRFTNWTITPVNSAIGLATVLDPITSQPRFTFVTQAGQTLQGTSLLAYICVEVLETTPSAFAPLVVNDIVALSPLASSPVPAYGEQGELVLIDGQPLLSGSLAATPSFTLYGNPGTNYFVQYTTNLLPPVAWITYTNLTLTGLQTNYDQASPSDKMEFFRSYYIAAPPRKKL